MQLMTARHWFCKAPPMRPIVKPMNFPKSHAGPEDAPLPLFKSTPHFYFLLAAYLFQLEDMQ